MTNSQGIEGLPPGVKAVRVFGGVIPWNDGKRLAGSVILAPDNAYGKWLDEVPVPEGWELDGTLEEAYRLPKRDEWYVDHNGDEPLQATRDHAGSIPRLIIRRKLSPLDALLEEAASAISQASAHVCILAESRDSMAQLAARLRAAKGGKA